MDFELGTELEQVRKTARALCDRFAPVRAKALADVHKHRIFPQALWDAAAEAGFLGCLIPEEYGGNGMGMQALGVALEELAANGYGNAFFVVTNMDASCIAQNGSEALKRNILPRIADGSHKMAFAVTEPDAGTNTFRITTHAKDCGDHYEVTGQKVFITGADVADSTLVVVRTTTREQCKEQGLPKTHGLSLLIIDRDAKGLELSKIPTHGIEGMNQFVMHFDGVKVPKDRLVGVQDQGVMAMFTSLNPERILAAAVACGMARYCLNKACAYANERKLFRDQPIGAYQGVQHPLADSFVELEAARLLTAKACWAYDQQKGPVEIGSAANLCKYFAAEMAIKTVDRAIQTHGGYGFSEEYELIWLWSSARLLRTAPINREMLLNFIAEHNLGLPRSY